MCSDSDTYSILISMYSKHHRTGEAFAILKEMEKSGHIPTLNAYKELLSVCGRQQLWEDTEKLFSEMQNSCKLDREAYHVMMKRIDMLVSIKKQKISWLR